jgi:hypothetical protein
MEKCINFKVGQKLCSPDKKLVVLTTGEYNLSCQFFKLRTILPKRTELQTRLNT